MAAPATFAANFSHGSITVTDGTPSTPLDITLDVDNGDLSISGLAAVLREVVAYERRGTLHAVALGSRTYPEVSFSAMLANWSKATTGSPLADMILGTSGSEYAARIGTLGSTHPVVTFNVTFEFTDYDGTSHDLTLHDVHVVFDFAEGDPSTLSFSGTVYGEIDGDLSMDES
jgi:hypothetical protein